MTVRLLLSIFVFFNFIITQAQLDFEVAVHPQEASWPALQSFVWGQHNDVYLIAGGRTDGLHRRQPFASFDPTFNNTSFFVVKPSTGEVWTGSVGSVAQHVADQLSSSNMEFVQVGNLLILAGGYGQSTSLGSKITFPSLLVLEVEEIIDAIQNGDDFSSFIHQASDENMAVCGGHLETLNGKIVLVGGHRFDGNYNPMGNPTYSQAYTNAIRSFQVDLIDNEVLISNYSEIVDTDLLHRRDYNLLPSLNAENVSELILFSGVFQPTADLPYLDCIAISDENTFNVVPSFSQYLNQYHTASVAVHSNSSNRMSYIFFGGISQYYYDEAGVLVNDINVPFTKNISAVSRDNNNEWSEYLVDQLPSYLGASAEFLPIDTDGMWNNGILNYDMLEGDSTLIGYVYGGIESSDANIFWVNTGVESWASSVVYEVYLKSATTSSIEIYSSSDPVQLQVFPNPSAREIHVQFELQEASEVKLDWTDINGKKLNSTVAGKYASGKNELIWNVPSDWASGRYICTLNVNGVARSLHVMIEK